MRVRFELIGLRTVPKAESSSHVPASPNPSNGPGPNPTNWRPGHFRRARGRTAVPPAAIQRAHVPARAGRTLLLVRGQAR